MRRVSRGCRIGSLGGFHAHEYSNFHRFIVLARTHRLHDVRAVCRSTPGAFAGSVSTQHDHTRGCSEAMVSHPARRFRDAARYRLECQSTGFRACASRCQRAAHRQHRSSLRAILRT